jgi:L-alanine-DL-glutamate epimerase-like enolase superfamily enzyme
LYRAVMPIVSCSFSGSGLVSVSDIANNVKDQISLTGLDDNGTARTLRGRLSLMMHASALSERALSALDAALFSSAAKESNASLIALALKLRTDCVRVLQALIESPQSCGVLLDDL